MNRFFNYLNHMPWAKPMAMFVIISDLAFIWVALVMQLHVDSNLRDVVIGVTCIVAGGNYTKSYLEHKVNKMTGGNNDEEIHRV